MPPRDTFPDPEKPAAFSAQNMGVSVNSLLTAPNQFFAAIAIDFLHRCSIDSLFFIILYLASIDLACPSLETGIDQTTHSSASPQSV